MATTEAPRAASTPLDTEGPPLQDEASLLSTRGVLVFVPADPDQPLVRVELHRDPAGLRFSAEDEREIIRLIRELLA